EAGGESGKEEVAGGGGMELAGRECRNVRLLSRGEQRAAARAVGDDDRELPAQIGQIEQLGLAAARLQIIDAIERMRRSQQDLAPRADLAHERLRIGEHDAAPGAEGAERV